MKKRTKFILIGIGIFIVLSVIIGIASDEDSTVASSSSGAPQQQASEQQQQATMGQRNALRSANQYLQFTSFSRNGLIEQLEFEGYSNADAVYAVDNSGADWNDQAAKKAIEYLDFMSFSRNGLIDQLLFEGFTREQAVHGVEAIGY